MSRTLPIGLLPFLLFAQNPAPPFMKYSGEPIRIPFACDEEQLQAAGLICTEAEPCSIYLELSTLAPAGKKLFLGGNLHSESGTLFSIMLSSDDAGATWKEPTPRIRGAALDQIQIYDLEHAWAAGEVQTPLPQDPFFLISTDGGQTWREHPVSDQGGPGSIERFWFDSARHGELIVDAGRSAEGGRYRVWETETGGSSWMARSATAKAPVLKHAPPAGEGDFRIRATGKSYEIEKRMGEKWQVMSSFLIEAAACKIKPAETKEPLAVTDAPAAKDAEEQTKPAAPKTTATPAVPAKKGPPLEQ